MYLLSHRDSLVSDSHVNVTGLLRDTITTAFCTRCEALQDRTFFDINRRDFQFVDICTIVVLGIRNCGFQNTLDDSRTLLRTKRQNVKSLINFFAANQIGDQTALFSMNVSCVTPYFLPRRETIIEVVRLLRRVFFPFVC